MKTSKLTGAALDWAVAKCEGHKVFVKYAPLQIMYTPKRKRSLYTYRPSTNWAQGGLIIDRETISLDYAQEEDWAAKTSAYQWAYGPTPLIAAMRCYVASKLGDDVNIPDELYPQ